MDFISDFLGYALPFLIVLTVLVFVHEQGHYLVARWCGVRVEVFSIGFGRELFGWNDKHGTRWKICLIPFGGYVKFFGDEGAASAPGAEVQEMSAADRAVSFHHKPLASRAAIVVAGPMANYLFAIIVMAGMFMFVGRPFTPAVVSQVVPDSAAAVAGFQVDDRVVRIEGEEIDHFEQMRQIVMLSIDKELLFEIDRAGVRMTIPVKPQVVEITDQAGNKHRVGRLGVASTAREFIRHGPFSAVWQATKQTVFITTATLKGIGQMIGGERDSKELRGPLGIVQMSGQAAQYGVLALVNFMVFLSISLGMINLFPIPMLDGGHLLFYAIEALRGKPLGEKAIDFGFRIGLGMVMALMIYATWNDIVNFGVVGFLAGLFS